MKAEDVVHRDICIFRGRAIGGRGSVQDVLELFSVPQNLTKDIACANGGYEDENIAVLSEAIDEDIRIKINFKTTLI